MRSSQIPNNRNPVKTALTAGWYLKSEENSLKIRVFREEVRKFAVRADIFSLNTQNIYVSIRIYVTTLVEQWWTYHWFHQTGLGSSLPVG